MAKVHHTIRELGRQGALLFAETAIDRKALEAASNYLSNEESPIGYLFSGWCQTALPHKRLDDNEIWSLETDYVKLMIEPGSMHGNDGVVRVGVPFGSRARLILLYLQSEAIRTDSREIELGRSLRVWLGKLGVSIGGKSMKDVRDQALRLSRCRMTFQISHGDKIGFINQNLVDTAMFSDDSSGSLLETVRLSEGFFDELKRHPVPLQESAIRALSNNSQALDVYCWLAYRLHSLRAPTPVTWPALYAQFGAGYSSLKNFKMRFSDSLTMALAVYPDAKVCVESSRLLLHPSAPAVPKADTKRFKLA